MSRVNPFALPSRNIATPDQIPLMAVQLMNGPQCLDPIRAKLFAAAMVNAVWLEWFTFTATWNTLLASASGQQVTTTVDPGIDFILMQLNLTAFTTAGTVNANPDYLLEIQEKSGSSNFSDTTVHVSNMTGQNRNSGSKPFDLPFPRYIRGNNTLLAKLTNLTATAARVDLAYTGIRVTYTTDRVNRELLFGVPF